MLTRNLRLLVVDDSELAGNVPPAIEVVRIGDHGRIGFWLGHCESLARDKVIDFDLLSIDILFDRDGTDPSAAFLPTAALERMQWYNCAGLYHGMMALARRSHADQYGNSIPVSWEIRSVSASSLDHPELRAEAVRAYGLLRSFLARPNEGEDLEKCIIREAQQETPPRILRPGRNIQETFLEDLRLLPGVAGSALGIVGRVLQQWRFRVREAVRANEMTLDVRILQEHRQRLATAEKGTARALLDELYLPIAGWQQEEEYGIGMISIFADLVPEFQGEWAGLVEQEEDAWVSRVVGWLEDLASLAGPAPTEDYFLRLARFAHETSGKDPQRMAEWWKSARPLERCFVYCVLLVRSHVLPNRYPDVTDDVRAGHLGLIYTQKTFLAPFKKSHFGGCDTASEFKVELRRSLDGNGELLHVSWLRSVLRRFCREVLSVEATALAKRAPGLVEQ